MISFLGVPYHTLINFVFTENVFDFVLSDWLKQLNTSYLRIKYKTMFVYDMLMV